MNKLISIIVGILFGYLIFVLLNPIYKGPNSNSFRKKIFHDKIKNKCFKFDPKIYICGR